jgi:inosose dehydratase
MRIGSAPDSWGVWFPDDPRQTPAMRFLDEVAEAGYRWIELGPYGYLPTDVDELERELAARDLHVCGTFVQFDLHDRDALRCAQDEVESTCRLLRRLGASVLIVIDGMYSDLRTGEQLSPAELDDQGWRQLVESARRVADAARGHGLVPVFHPHADTHVELEPQIERLLDDVPELQLCLDVGHHAYRAGGDPVAFFRRHAERVGHLHLKSVDEERAARVRREGIPFAQAVAEGVFVEPAAGVVDFEALRDAIVDSGYAGFGIVEQDMYPVDFDVPLPIARRTFQHFQGLGLA